MMTAPSMTFEEFEATVRTAQATLKESNASLVEKTLAKGFLEVAGRMNPCGFCKQLEPTTFTCTFACVEQKQVKVSEAPEPSPKLVEAFKRSTANSLRQPAQDESGAHECRDTKD